MNDLLSFTFNCFNLFLTTQKLFFKLFLTLKIYKEMQILCLIKKYLAIICDSFLSLECTSRILSKLYFAIQLVQLRMCPRSRAAGLLAESMSILWNQQRPYPPSSWSQVLPGNSCHGARAPAPTKQWLINF